MKMFAGRSFDGVQQGVSYMEVHRVSPESASAPIVLTDPALEKVKVEMARANLQGYALRISVIGGGCSGYQYDMDFTNEDRGDDVVGYQNGVKIVLDEKTANILQGTTVDYEDAFGHAGFKFQNPNAAKTCGCGESFSV